MNDLNQFLPNDIFILLKEQKNKINSIKHWPQCVKLSNPYENINYFDKKKRISRAFYKIHEIDQIFNIINKNNENFTIGNLCEAPGGFTEYILNLRKNLPTKILTQSLLDCNIQFSKKIPKDIITFGSKMNGDLYDKVTIYDFVGDLGPADLITADGGIDVSNDYINQEILSFKLVLSQIITAFLSLKFGGNFVLKIFDIFTLKTVQLLYIIKNNFESFNIYKPLVSRPCNSEKYIIAKGFNKNYDINLLFDLFYNNDLIIDLSPEFKNYIIEFNIKDAKSQIDALYNTFNICETIKNKSIIQDLKNRQKNILKEYVYKFKIHNLTNYF